MSRNTKSKTDVILMLCCNSFASIDRAKQHFDKVFSANIDVELEREVKIAFMDSVDSLVTTYREASIIPIKEGFKLTRNKRGLFQWKPTTANAQAIIKEHVG